MKTKPTPDQIQALMELCADAAHYGQAITWMLKNGDYPEGILECLPLMLPNNLFPSQRCPNCNQLFRPRRKGKTFCSHRCASAHGARRRRKSPLPDSGPQYTVPRSDQVIRGCTAQGCDKRYWAKGLCFDHYRAAYQKQRQETPAP